MLTIEISWEEIKFFIALIIAGSLYGYHCYMRGKKIGFDDAMYLLESEGLISIDDDGRIGRVSDREFREIQESMAE